MSWISLLARSMRTTAFQTNTKKVLLQSAMRMSDGFTTDGSGRRVRSRPRGEDAWSDDNDDWGAPSPSSAREGRRRQMNKWDDDDDDDDWGAPSQQSNRRDSGGWDDFDINDFGNGSPSKRRNQQPRGRRGGGDRRSYNDNNSNNNWRRNTRQNGPPSSRNPQRQRQSYKKNPSDGQDKQRSINMNSLEGAGFVHLYGLSSIVNALKANRRDVTTSHEKSDMWGASNVDDDEDLPTKSTSPPPPQAQFRPYLFVQERANTSQRRGAKAAAEQEILELAQDHDIPIAHVDKGILNTLSGNRPHQGIVLRCGKLYFEPLSRIPPPDGDQYPDLWLVLDEVVDPQNLGALIRSAYFLGHQRLGVMVCSKNSAPPTPVVSAASAGALEVQTVYSTNNLPRTLQNAVEDGWRIIGASSSVPKANSDDDPPPLYDLQDLPGPSDGRPTLLVLGSEGHGLRTLVAKACTEFVRIPSGADGGINGNVDTLMNDEDNDQVDSLNVSVTGGILLWHLLRGVQR